MALRQLGRRLCPSLLESPRLASGIHGSALFQGVGIPERKIEEEHTGLYEGARCRAALPGAPPLFSVSLI